MSTPLEIVTLHKAWNYGSRWPFQFALINTNDPNMQTLCGFLVLSSEPTKI